MLRTSIMTKVVRREKGDACDIAPLSLDNHIAAMLRETAPVESGTASNLIRDVAEDSTTQLHSNMLSAGDQSQQVDQRTYYT